MNQNQNPKLYVGNLNFEANEEQVRELFGSYGGVEDVKVVMDRISGRSRGFAFVRMATPEDAEKAKEALHSYSFQGKTLVIDYARAESPAGDRPRMGDRRPMGGGGGGGGGGGDRPRREWGGPRSDRGGGGGGGGGFRGGDSRGGDSRGGGFYNR